MEAVFLYLGLLAAILLSNLLAQASVRPICRLRNLPVVASYVVLVALFFFDPWWRVLTVWCLIGLAAGTICWLADRAWLRRGRELQPELSWPNNWWLIPLGLVAWPDMLSQTAELAAFNRRVFWRPNQEESARR
jgi:hypothetical protein